MIMVSLIAFSPTALANKGIPQHMIDAAAGSVITIMILTSAGIIFAVTATVAMLFHEQRQKVRLAYPHAAVRKLTTNFLNDKALFIMFDAEAANAHLPAFPLILTNYHDHPAVKSEEIKIIKPEQSDGNPTIEYRTEAAHSKSSGGIFRLLLMTNCV